MEQLMNQNPWLGWLLILLLLWSLPWKAMALWRAAKRDQKIWFVIFIIFNTIGILEILYLFIFGKEKNVTTPEEPRSGGTGFQKIV
jgi:hypothetical protein